MSKRKRKKSNQEEQEDLPLYKKQIFIVVLLVFISLFSYVQSFSYDFCYDDVKLIVNRVSDYEASGIVATIFKVPFWGSSPERDTQYYRPIVTLTYWMNYKVSKLNPSFYHFTNILIHTSNGLLLYFIVKLLSRRKDLAFLIALIFIVHPIHTSSVAWVSGRTDLLTLLFLLLSYLTFVKLRKRKEKFDIKNYSMVGILYFLALLCKETALLFPILLFVSDKLIFLRQDKIADKKSMYLPYASSLLALALYLLLRAAVLDSSLPMSIIHEALSLKAFFHIPSIFTYYIKAMFLPIKFYLHPSWAIPSSLTELSSMVNFVVFGALIVSFFYFKKVSIRLAILIFSLSVAPVLYTLLSDPVKEYWAYIPSVAFAIIAGELLFSTNKWKIGSIKVGYALTCVLIVFYIILCWIRNPVFKNNYELYKDGIQKRPDMTFYYINLGAEVNDPYYAKALFERAIEIDPNVEAAYRNIGVLYENGGSYEKAVEYYKKELELHAGNVTTLKYLGGAYLKLQNTEAALEYYKEALSVDPEFVSIELYKDAVDYYSKSDMTSAVVLMELITENSLSVPQAYLSLGSIYAQEGRLKEALTVWQKFIELFPDHESVKDAKAWIDDVEKQIESENK